MRIHGRRGMVYVGIASGAPASRVAFLSDWEINWAIGFREVTAYGDPQKVWVAVLNDISGSFSGFYDDASRQLYTAARDGVPRNFYLYPDTKDDPVQFWFGQIIPEFSVSGGVAGSVDIKCQWVSASGIFLQASGDVYASKYPAFYGANVIS